MLIIYFNNPFYIYFDPNFTAKKRFKTIFYVNNIKPILNESLHGVSFINTCFLN